MKITIITNNAEETMRLGSILVRCLPNGSTVLLTGDLGAGKTTLVRGVAQALHISDTVQSPTFNIMKLYLKGDKPLIHIDAYRLKDIDQDIGLEEYIGYETGLTFIEWPEYIQNILPSDAISFSLKHLQDDQRELEICSQDEKLMEVLKNEIHHHS